MDGPARKAFAAATHRRRYAAGQTIYLQGEVGAEMYRIVQGSVRLSVVRRDGRELVLLFLQPSDCFGDSSLIDAGPRPQIAQAIADVELAVLDIAKFRQLRRDQPSFDDALLRLLATQMRAAATQYADSSLDKLRARILARLLVSANSFGVTVEGGVRLAQRLTQSELAMMVGASRQHVNRILKGLEAEQLIALGYGNILIRDIGALERRLDEDCHIGDRVR